MAQDRETRSDANKLHSFPLLISSIIACLAFVISVGAIIVYFRFIPSTQPVLSTQPVPPTQTDCPKEGTARAFVTAPLILGNHQNVVYVSNQQYGGSSLLRYNINTRQTTTILKTTHFHFSQAHVTANRQWIIFIASDMDEMKMQMIRIDGQGLQTLFCSHKYSRLSGLGQYSLSPDGKLLAIQGINASVGDVYIYLINLVNGTVQPDEMLPQQAFGSDCCYNIAGDGGSGYSTEAGQWLDNTHAYILNNADPQHSKLYLLDTAKGPHQHPNDLRLVIDLPPTTCWDYDPSLDGKQLFVVHCQSSTDANTKHDTFSGPSVITVLDPLGGPQKVVYTSSNLFISQIRAVNSTTLLFNVVRSVDGDTTKEGLWTIQTDNSHLTHPVNAHILLGKNCISSDARFYALSMVQDTTDSYTLMVGALTGGAPTPLPFEQNTRYDAIAGWTTV